MYYHQISYKCLVLDYIKKIERTFLSRPQKTDENQRSDNLLKRKI